MATINIGNILRLGDFKDFQGNDIACGTQLLRVGDLSISVAGNTLTITKAGVTTTYTPTIPNPTIVSADAGNLIIAGADGGAYLNCEAVQDCIGQAIANGVGITYDDALNAINGFVSSLAVTDSNTVDLSLAGQTITAAVKVDPAPENVLIAGANGLSVAPPDTLTFTDCAGNTLASIKGWF